MVEVNAKEQYNLFSIMQIIELQEDKLRLTTNFKKKMVEYSPLSKGYNFTEIILHSICDAAPFFTQQDLEMAANFVHNFYRENYPFVIEAMKREGRYEK